MRVPITSTKQVQQVFLGTVEPGEGSQWEGQPNTSGARLQASIKPKGQRSHSPSLLEQGEQARRGPGVSSFPPGPKLNTWLALCKPEGSQAVV